MPTARLQFWLFLIVRDRMGWHPGVVCVSGLVDRCTQELSVSLAWWTGA